MKKNYFLLLLFSVTISASGQQIDCSSGRFDQEIFSAVKVTTDIVYGSNVDKDGNTVALYMDIYEPDGDTMMKRPLIIWAHGGSFLAGGKNDADIVSLSEHFAKRGYVCASISYRLGIYPVNQDNATKAVYRAVQDMKASIRYMRKDAATINDYRIDTSIVYAGGSSAGAFTALHLAYLDQYSELPSQIDTSVMGDMEGNSGNPGYSSHVNAVIDLCGALADRSWIVSGDIPFVAMHGTQDGVVPYSRAMIYLLNIFPVMIVDGSFSIAQYADSIGVQNSFYTFYGADHVPYVSNVSYMDTTVRFVSNFLYNQLGCTPANPYPLPNTFTTGLTPVAVNGNVSVYQSGDKKINFDLIQNAESVSLFDISGKKIFEKQKPAAKFSALLPDLKSGLLIYRVVTSDKIISGKLFIN